ncbi:ABC transporter permease [Roseomonas sp. GC11]|uniref:ABC transporter permease n=1 Tax=Roseomonas sp. GC11 TaxID=2950546 RepID=UPI002108E5A8|nr:ABC transporter permease [Roseomonas sp. GC11]MCQ4162537.1 ABC transporter permease [Roseomonas sp. GC11]
MRRPLLPLLGLALAWIMLAASVIFLLAPLVVTVGVSLSPSPVFQLPQGELSWRWYARVGRLEGLLPAVLLSLQVAAFATAASLVLGTLAAIAVVRGQFPGREAIATFLVSPLMLPGLVIGLAMLQYFRALGLREALPSLLLAHVIIVLPYVMRTLVAGLALFDFALIDAARTLGLSYPRAVLRVMVPVLAPSFITGGLFGFLASFDNYPISIFLTDVYHRTLPIQLLQYLGESPDPTIAAVSTLIIALTLLVLFIGDRMVGLSRMAGV